MRLGNNRRTDADRPARGAAPGDQTASRPEAPRIGGLILPDDRAASGHARPACRLIAASWGTPGSTRDPSPAGLQRHRAGPHRRSNPDLPHSSPRESSRVKSWSRSPAANQAAGGGRRRRTLRQRSGDGFPRVRALRPRKRHRGKDCCGRPSEGSADVPIWPPAKSRSAGFAPEVVGDPVLLDRLASCHGSVLRTFFDRPRGDRVGVVRPVVRVTPSLPERPRAMPSGHQSRVRRRSRPCLERRRGPMMSPSKRSEGSWPS